MVSLGLNLWDSTTMAAWNSRYVVGARAYLSTKHVAPQRRHVADFAASLLSGLSHKDGSLIWQAEDGSQIGQDGIGNFLGDLHAELTTSKKTNPQILDNANLLQVVYDLTQTTINGISVPDDIRERASHLLSAALEKAQGHKTPPAVMDLMTLNKHSSECNEESVQNEKAQKLCTIITSIANSNKGWDLDVAINNYIQSSAKSFKANVGSVVQGELERAIHEFMTNPRAFIEATDDMKTRQELNNAFGELLRSTIPKEQAKSGLVTNALAVVKAFNTEDIDHHEGIAKARQEFVDLWRDNLVAMATDIVTKSKLEQYQTEIQSSIRTGQAIELPSKYLAAGNNLEGTEYSRGVATPRDLEYIQNSLILFERKLNNRVKEHQSAMIAISNAFEVTISPFGDEATQGIKDLFIERVFVDDPEAANFFEIMMGQTPDDLASLVTLDYQGVKHNTATYTGIQKTLFNSMQEYVQVLDSKEQALIQEQTQVNDREKELQDLSNTILRKYLPADFFEKNITPILDTAEYDAVEILRKGFVEKSESLLRLLTMDDASGEKVWNISLIQEAFPNLSARLTLISAVPSNITGDSAKSLFQNLVQNESDFLNSENNDSKRIAEWIGDYKKLAFMSARLESNAMMRTKGQEYIDQLSNLSRRKHEIAEALKTIREIKANPETFRREAATRLREFSRALGHGLKTDFEILKIGPEARAALVQQCDQYASDQGIFAENADEMSDIGKLLANIFRSIMDIIKGAVQG